MINFKFFTPCEFQEGINRLAKVLDFGFGEGITVTAYKGERIGFSIDGNNAVIYYKEKR